MGVAAVVGDRALVGAALAAEVAEAGEEEAAVAAACCAEFVAVRLCLAARSIAACRRRLFAGATDGMGAPSCGLDAAAEEPVRLGVAFGDAPAVGSVGMAAAPVRDRLFARALAASSFSASLSDARRSALPFAAAPTSAAAGSGLAGCMRDALSAVAAAALRCCTVFDRRIVRVKVLMDAARARGREMERTMGTGGEGGKRAEEGQRASEDPKPSYLHNANISSRASQTTFALQLINIFLQIHMLVSPLLMQIVDRES